MWQPNSRMPSVLYEDGLLLVQNLLFFHLWGIFFITKNTELFLPGHT
jgi:hypothetical protein